MTITFSENLKAVGGMGVTTALLARPCYSCGKSIDSGYKHCPKCNIYLCFMCRLILQRMANEFPAKCPMCGGEFLC